VHLLTSKPVDQCSSFRGAWQVTRILLRPLPGFYVLRLRRGAPCVPALIHQLCPMVVPQPTVIRGPDPNDWCRPVVCSPRFGALVDGKPSPIERVWMACSLRPISPEEYAFRIGPLRRWARVHPGMPEASPDKPVDLDALASLF
jgi:hypothetical protein